MTLSGLVFFSSSVFVFENTAIIVATSAVSKINGNINISIFFFSIIPDSINPKNIANNIIIPMILINILFLLFTLAPTSPNTSTIRNPIISIITKYLINTFITPSAFTASTAINDKANATIMFSFLLSSSFPKTFVLSNTANVIVKISMNGSTTSINPIFCNNTATSFIEVIFGLFILLLLKLYFFSNGLQIS